MNEQDFLLLSAYIDGELDKDQTEILEQRQEDEPTLKLMLDQLRSNDQLLRVAAHSIDEEPMPENLQVLLSNNNESSKQDSLLKLPNARAATRSLKWFAAIAASITLVLGIVIGQFQHEDHFEQLVAAGTFQPTEILVEILDEVGSGSSSKLGELHVAQNLSFLREDEVFCRHYAIQDEQAALDAIACFIDGKWHNTVLAPGRLMPSNRDTYQPASATTDTVISNYIQERIQGVPLTQSEEVRYLKSLRERSQ